MTCFYGKKAKKKYFFWKIKFKMADSKKQRFSKSPILKKKFEKRCFLSRPFWFFFDLLIFSLEKKSKLAKMGKNFNQAKLFDPNQTFWRGVYSRWAINQHYWPLGKKKSGVFHFHFIPEYKPCGDVLFSIRFVFKSSSVPLHQSVILKMYSCSTLDT